VLVAQAKSELEKVGVRLELFRKIAELFTACLTDLQIAEDCTDPMESVQAMARALRGYILVQKIQADLNENEAKALHAALAERLAIAESPIAFPVMGGR